MKLLKDHKDEPIPALKAWSYLMLMLGHRIHRTKLLNELLGFIEVCFIWIRS